MGHPNADILMAAKTASNDGRYHFAYPLGDGTFFRMLYASASDPQAGWPSGSARPSGDQFTRELILGGGPGGANIYRQTQNFSNTGAFGGDEDFGWGSDFWPLQPAGMSRFYRWRQRFSSATNFDGRSQETGEAGQISRTKLLIIGDGTATDLARVIVATEGTPAVGGGPHWRYSIGIDGGDYIQFSPYYTHMGDWDTLQAEVHYSTALDEEDGYFKLWINSNSYASPTLEATGIIVNRPDSDALSYGYQNNGRASGGVYVLEQYDFAISHNFLVMP